MEETQAEKAYQNQRETLFDLAQLRNRKVMLTEIGSWLEDKLNTVNQEYSVAKKMKFHKEVIRLKARREALLEMAEYFLRKV